MTKEQLLQKGISPEVADEIIAAYADGNAENSLQTLEKALNDDAQESLFKAKKGGDDDEAEEEDEEEDEKDEEYNEAYMKKYMKKYMKDNSKSCLKMMKEVGAIGEEMKKAISSVDTDADGAVIEMADLKPFLESMDGFIESMTKAVSNIAGQVAVITAQNEQSFGLMQKAARVTVEQAKGLDAFMSTPTGRKSVVADMAKAENGISTDSNKKIYAVLEKATKSGDSTAGEIISAFESNGKDANRLTRAARAYIAELFAKENK